MIYVGIKLRRNNKRIKNDVFGIGDSMRVKTYVSITAKNVASRPMSSKTSEFAAFSVPSIKIGPITMEYSVAARIRLCVINKVEMPPLEGE